MKPLTPAGQLAPRLVLAGEPAHGPEITVLHRAGERPPEDAERRDLTVDTRLVRLGRHHIGILAAALDPQRHAGAFAADEFPDPVGLRNQLLAAAQGDRQCRAYLFRNGRFCNKFLIHKGFI